MDSAQFRLAYHYLQGIGTDIDKAEAISSWMQAARQGHTLSQYNLGRAFYEGIGIEKDTAKAVHWLQLAPKKDNKRSIKAMELISSKPDDIQQKATADVVPPNLPATLPIYFSPEVSISKITSLTPEQIESSEVLSTKGQWHKIKYDHNIALWLYKRFVKINDDKTVRFIGNNARSRKEPIIKDGKIVIEIKEGSQFPLIQQNENGYK